jgi:NADPH-dependent curcumin reductase CurA
MVRNKQVILKNYSSAVLKETDMEVVCGEVLLQLEPGSSDDVLVRNLYLSADPYMRHRINGVQGSYIPPFTPGQVHIFPTLT